MSHPEGGLTVCENPPEQTAERVREPSGRKNWRWERLRGLRGAGQEPGGAGQGTKRLLQEVAREPAPLAEAHGLLSEPAPRGRRWWRAPAVALTSQAWKQGRNVGSSAQGLRAGPRAGWAPNSSDPSGPMRTSPLSQGCAFIDNQDGQDTHRTP